MNAKKKYEVVIIGGGSAGMSAALWCSDLGLGSVLIEKNDELGGQLSMIHNPIKNYLGLTTRNGMEMREHFLRSIEAADFDLVIGKAVVSADLQERLVELQDGSAFEAEAIIIATGVRRRKLGVEGEDDFAGRGILASGAKEAKTVKGKKVLIVGGGDAALENALILSEYADSVTLVHRRNEFTARNEFLERAKNLHNVTWITEHIVERFHGSDSLEGATLRSVINDSSKEIRCDFCLVRIGVQPNSELFSSQLDVDNRGYINVDPDCRSSIENVYAVGDAANPRALTISSAVGNAAVAVSNISKRKENT